MKHPNVIGFQIESDQIFATLGERVYGSSVDPAAWYNQETPSAFDPLRKLLMSSSKLLAVDKDTEEFTKDDIFSAYGADWELLQKHLTEFERFLKKAIRASISSTSVDHDDKEERTDNQWQQLQRLVPKSSKVAVLQLRDTTAALGREQLLECLQTEFIEGVNRVIKKMAFWLQALVEEEWIGLIEWCIEDVCRYHYFQHSNTSEVTSTETKYEQDEELERAHTKKVVEHTQFRIRNVHHLVKARRHERDEYKGSMPQRIKNLMQYAPDWMLSQLAIVDGQVTMEEKIHGEIGKSKVEVIETSKWYYDPALTFDDVWVLAGWKDSERDTSTTTDAEDKFFNRLLIAVAVVALTVIGCTFYLVEKHEEKKALAYKEFVANFDTASIRTALPGEILALDVIEPQIAYRGIGQGAYLHVTVERSGNANLRPFQKIASYQLPKWGGDIDVRYGAVSFEGIYGAPIGITVIKATNEELQYVVNPLPKE